MHLQLPGPGQHGLRTEARPGKSPGSRVAHGGELGSPVEVGHDGGEAFSAASACLAVSRSIVLRVRLIVHPSR